MSDGGEFAELPTMVLAELVELPQTEAIALLRQGNWWSVSVGILLAEWALARADFDVAQAERGLALARLIAAEKTPSPALLGQIAYAEARCAVQRGDLATAESALRQAQAEWMAIDARSHYARTFLGLTQLLAMQGRYGEAGDAAQGAIDALLPLVESSPEHGLLLARAYRNRANLAVYLEEHTSARDNYLLATEELIRFQATLPPEEQGELAAEFGHLALNLASAYTFLDAPDEAERLLREAIERFDTAGEVVNRGRAQTNLGRLYLRVGEYATALAAFDAATRDLLGDIGASPVSDAVDADAEIAALRQADELLLEQALAYLSLNLLPEAALALERCERLFRTTGQPYELAQSRYSQGVLRLLQGNLGESAAALDEALAIYAQLGNEFWRNRTQTARARLAVAQGNREQAVAILDALLAAPEIVRATGAVMWDRLGLTDVWLMRVQLWLEAGEVAQAMAATENVASLLEVADAELDAAPPLPHLALRLYHARGRVYAASGDAGLARRYFSAAVELLDRQRAALPLEEVRSAFLGDKMAMYSDLVVNLLASPLPSDDEVAAAFAIVERARSRALLERLLASVEAAGDDANAEVSAQRATLRRQLHWLYNQLLGDNLPGDHAGDRGNRSLDGHLGREVALHEAALQRLEWRSAPLLAQAEPVRLDELQQILDDTQEALIYYFAGDEVLAFVVGKRGARVVRQVTTVAAVNAAQAELRFQLGRAEVGNEYVMRHHARLMRGVQEALGRLYELLVAPLAEMLVAEQLLLIPYGVLHLVPFHALWDGGGYWLERVEISYAPSASIAVHRPRAGEAMPLRRFAGFAPFDARIPQAQAEIDSAATYFEDAARYHDAAATVETLKIAARVSDVLHLATHGLFRPDNSFFSAIKLADGWMDVREIYRLDLAARVVVLSACESGVGEVRAGDEVVGLARGFLAAGTQHLIATLWNVHDQSAAALMDTFYQALQRTSDVVEARKLEDQGFIGHARPAAALRSAQRFALQSGAHPYYWASFFAIG